MSGVHANFTCAGGRHRRCRRSDILYLEIEERETFIMEQRKEKCILVTQWWRRSEITGLLLTETG